MDITEDILNYIIEDNNDKLLKLYNDMKNNNKINYSYIYEKIKDINGNSTCYYFIGHLYYYGICVEQNYKKTIELYNISIKLNNSNAMNSLAVMYENGDGIEQNIMKAIELYEQAIKLNNSLAMTNLGNLYYCDKKYNDAIKLYKMAIKLNNSDAMIAIGNIYYDGVIIEKNYKKTIELYEKAIKLNNSDAMIYLRDMYINGEGVNRDINKGIELYIKSIKLNNEYAIDNLILVKDLSKENIEEILYTYSLIKNDIYIKNKLKLEKYIIETINIVDMYLDLKNYLKK